MRIPLSIFTLSLLLNANELEQINITAEPLIIPALQPDESVYTGSELTTRALELSGVAGSNSIYEASEIFGSVNVESVSKNSLSPQQGSVRIRGVDASLGSMSIDGVPNYGLGPIGARDYIYDIENIDSISLYKGSVPTNIGIGVGSRAGAIVVHPKFAKDEMGFNLRQTLGRDSYSKTYFRGDSGKFGNSAISISASHAEGKKHKGVGDGERDNLNLTITHAFDSGANLKLWYNHNNQKADKYRALTDHKGDLKQDFIDDTSSKFHYKYNILNLKNRDLIAYFDAPVAENIKLSLKPYYSKESSFELSHTQNPIMIQKRVRDLTRYGVLAGAEIGDEASKFSIGYHYENNDATVHNEQHKIVANALVFDKIAGYATDGVTHTHSPYIKYSSDLGALKYQAGVKYFLFKDSDLANANPALNRSGRDYKLWLPSFGLSYDIDSSIQIYTNYARGFIRPYSYAPLVSVYSQNMALFQTAGITAQNLFDGYRPEKSDTIDLGLRYIDESFEISPTLFFAKHKNLLTPISDDRVGGIKYSQNIAKATSFGAELNFSYFIDDRFTIYANPSFMRFKYDDNILSASTKGNQVVDVPKWMLNSGVIYEQNSFLLSPNARYVGSRYADATNGVKIDGRWLFDIKGGYRFKNFYAKSDLALSMELQNIFNKKYISVINPADDLLGGATYYSGSPRAFYMSASLSF